MSRFVDLDAARAARAEKAGDPVVVRFGGEEFTLPPELPFEAVELIQAEQIGKGLRALLGEGGERFFALKPSLQDVEALADQAIKAYGMNPGESPASSDS